MNGRSVPFPKRLLNMIRKEAILSPDIVRWSMDGVAFYVDDESKFISISLPRYGFKATKMQSFQRNLNIYGFTRLSKGPYASGYVHPEFGRDIEESQLEWILRENVKKEIGVGGIQMKKLNHSRNHSNLSLSTISGGGEEDESEMSHHQHQDHSKRILRRNYQRLQNKSNDEQDKSLYGFMTQPNNHSLQQEEGGQDINAKEKVEYSHEPLIERMKKLENDYPPQEEQVHKASNFWSLPHSCHNDESSTTCFASTLSLLTNVDDDDNDTNDNTEDKMMKVHNTASHYNHQFKKMTKRKRVSYTTISTVRAPQDLMFDHFMDKLYVKKCIPEISIQM